MPHRGATSCGNSASPSRTKNCRAAILAANKNKQKQTAAKIAALQFSVIDEERRKTARTRRIRSPIPFPSQPAVYRRVAELVSSDDSQTTFLGVLQTL